MPSYLVHFNRLHDKRGRFTYGDGDGDGQRSDISKSARKNPGKSRDQNTGHHRYEKNNTYKRVRLDDGKVSKDWNDATRRGYGRALETGNSLASNRRAPTAKTHGSISRNISSFGSTPPKKTPETKPGVGNGRPIGRDYGGTSRGAAAMTPINDTNAVAEELTEDMLEKRKKDEVKDYWQKKYQNAAAKGKSYVDRLFGTETTTNAKSSDKYKKTDTSGNHGKRK